eukprot:68929-Chlamydomonas_euryale.AAC.1
MYCAPGRHALGSQWFRLACMYVCKHALRSRATCGLAALQGCKPRRHCVLPPGRHSFAVSGFAALDGMLYPFVCGAKDKSVLFVCGAKD